MAAPESAKESQGKGTLSRAGARARIEESEPHIFHCDDFVLLTDDSKCRLARIEDIYILEAFRNATLVHFAEDKLLIRRSLGECERRLDSSIFFRASRDCIVNLSQVKRPYLLKDGGLIFLLKDGRGRLFSQARRSLPYDTRPLAAEIDSWRIGKRRETRISVEVTGQRP